MIMSTKTYRVTGYKDWDGISIFQGQVAINSVIAHARLKIRRIRNGKYPISPYIYYWDYNLEYIGSEDPINYINQT